MNLTPAQYQTALMRLSLFHILIIASSNYLVQLPITIFGFHTTWGAFSFPFIFLATDLTVRIFGAGLARKIIQTVMLPALTVSRALGALFEGSFQGGQSGRVQSLCCPDRVSQLRLIWWGQFMDVVVFNRLRLLGKAGGWHRRLSTLFGNLVDTIAFFSIAFWRSTDPFMAEHWVEIATVDYVFKLLISLGLFVPAFTGAAALSQPQAGGEAGLAGLQTAATSLMRLTTLMVVNFLRFATRFAQLNENDYCYLVFRERLHLFNVMDFL